MSYIGVRVRTIFTIRKAIGCLTGRLVNKCHVEYISVMSRLQLVVSPASAPSLDPKYGH
jgi:hypothetical protein